MLLIAAHPDDETIGAGALLSREPLVQIVHATEGAPQNMTDAMRAGFSSQSNYACARIAEVNNALRLAGIPSQSIQNLRYTDQRVVFHLRELALDILNLIQILTPAIVLSHAYEGGHPDHDSVAFACHLALKKLRSEGIESGPRLMEFAEYHGQNGSLNTHEFLPEPSVREIRCELTESERALKTKMLSAFASQAKTLQAFLPPEREFFRDAPAYDFTQPPHSGQLYYEKFDWGIDGPTWRELASKTLRELPIHGERI